MYLKTQMTVFAAVSVRALAYIDFFSLGAEQEEIL